MASYADVARFRRRYTQAKSGDDTLIQECLDDATSMIDLELGFTWADYDTVATARPVLGYGTAYLLLPPHQIGSVTEVRRGTPTDTLVPSSDYTEQTTDGSLYMSTATGFPYGQSYWQPGLYSVTAKWGHGPVLSALAKVCVELAINMYKERDRGMYSDVIGVDTSGGVTVGYARAFTNSQQRTLDQIRAKYTAFAGAVA